ncbi:hypothetical protein CASFOL_020087 [Castilleja foliolosa]|uniref:Uncharacterized protein n=1 Tax=Castilleja foliolosa TaxID=1961234 RepID=A0ABD3BXE1_9LAMI
MGHGVLSGMSQQRKEVKSMESGNGEKGVCADLGFDDGQRRGGLGIFDSAAHETGNNNGKGERFSNEVCYENFLQLWAPFDD